MVATPRGRGAGSGRRQPRGGAGGPRGGGELGARQQRDRPPPPPPQQPHLSGRGAHASAGESWQAGGAGEPAPPAAGLGSRRPARRRRRPGTAVLLSISSEAPAEAPRQRRALRMRGCEPAGGESAPPRHGTGVDVRAPAGVERRRALD